MISYDEMLEAIKKQDPYILKDKDSAHYIDAVLYMLKDGSDIMRIDKQNFENWALMTLVRLIAGHLKGEYDLSDYFIHYVNPQILRSSVLNSYFKK